jgi:excisionase family DNA binding protein
VRPPAPVGRSASATAEVTQMNDSAWLTTSQVCDYLGVSASTYAKWRMRGDGPPARRLPNGQLRIHRHDLEAWLKSLPAAL